MQINYNVTGERRKQLVKAIGEILEVTPKYKGAPSFVYEVNHFTIDKNGVLSFNDRTGSEDSKKLLGALAERGFNYQAHDRFIIELPCEGITDRAIENLHRLLTNKETLIEKALGTDTLSFEVREDKISFPWFTGEHTPREISA